MAQDRFLATYHIETAQPLQAAAELLAREASTGTFLPLPGETEELRARYGARVERITELEQVDQPSLPGGKRPQSPQERYTRAEITLSFPLENIGPSLPNLMATVAGGSYDLNQFTGMRLIDLDLPSAFAEVYGGPQFGVPGTRKLSGVYDRPIIGTIMKPSVGMTPEQTGEIVRDLAEAGLDFIKDDECMANPPHSPLPRRVEEVMRSVNEAADRTGRKLMYAFNITDDLDAMLRHHDTVLAAGGTCIMVSINPVGLAGVAHLRKHSQLPIHAHRNGWGMMSRYPWLGMGFGAYQKIWRLAGVDQLHCSGIRNKFWDTDDVVAESAKACLASQSGMLPVMPVLSSGQWAGQTVDIYQRVGSLDLMHVCGGGIIGHPGGVSAGVMSVRQGWEAALAGKSLEEYSQDHEELRIALEAFGR